jgi:hypothetical protein
MVTRPVAGVLRTVAVIIAACGVVACQQPSIACGDPSPLVDHPRGIVVAGARVGPLLVTIGMAPGEPTARLVWSRPEQLSKYIITRVDQFDVALTLTGRRCEDGRAMRFAQGLVWNPDASLSTDEIERLTMSSLLIDPSPPASVQTTGETAYTGYFVFSAPGKWLIEAKQGERVVGTAVIEVIRPT